jgi:hypothetical protein
MLPTDSTACYWQPLMSLGKEISAVTPIDVKHELPRRT